MGVALSEAVRGDTQSGSLFGNGGAEGDHDHADHGICRCSIHRSHRSMHLEIYVKARQWHELWANAYSGVGAGCR